jgi:threonine synthase
MVSDDEILAAQKLLAAKGGLFGEPASAASLAGLIKLKSQVIILPVKNRLCHHRKRIERY